MATTRSNPAQDPELAQLFDDYLAEMTKLVDAGARIALDLDPMTAVSMIGQLQLAARVQQNDGESVKRVRVVIEGVRDSLIEGNPAIAKVIDMGDDPAHDQEGD